MRKALGYLAAIAMSVALSGQSRAAPPAAITIGDLYASTGVYASVSTSLHDGLLLWINETNAAGGVYVGAFDKRIPLKIVAYDDQSSTATVATLTNQLITRDKVDILVADFGSVLASVSVPVAREYKVLLINPSGTGAPLFSKDNPYNVLVAQPASSVAMTNLAGFIAREAAASTIRRVAILYHTNDFSSAQAVALRAALAGLHSAATIIYDKGVPTTTSQYTTLLNELQAAEPDLVVELGYAGNDIAFLRNMGEVGAQFRAVFTNYAGWEPDLVAKAVGTDGVKGVFTNMAGAFLEYKTTAGMTAKDFRAAWDKAYPDGKVPYGLNSAVGYVTGVAIGAMLAHAPDLSQLGMRAGLYAVSGKMVTLQGPFRLADDGQQLGEVNAVGQIWPGGKDGVELHAVFPPDVATDKPVFGH